MGSFPQFVGAAYRSESPNVAASRLINAFIERTQSQTDQTFPRGLFRRPGIRSYVTGLDGWVRAEFSEDGRAFAVAGDTFYELTGYNTYTVRGTVAADDQPASIASNGHGGHQLIVISGGSGYIFDLNTSTLTPIISASFPTNAVMVDFLDGYFLVLQASTSKVFVSAAEDGLTWNALDVLSVSSSSDSLVAIRVINRNLWMFGSQRSEPWVSTGAASIFQPYANILVEQGVGAPWSVAEGEGSIFLVQKNSEGGAMAVRVVGYAFQKISTHSEDRILTDLPDISSCIGWSYQEHGHTHYLISTPTGAALDYDLATGEWAQWGQWDEGTATYGPLKQACHMFAFGKHLVGDRLTGTIYEQSLDIGTDDGTPIRVERQAPHLNDGFQYLFANEVILGVETGLADADDPSPYLDLSWSKDGGHTFSTPIPASLGAAGHYAHLVRWQRVIGRFADLILRVTTSTTRPLRIFSCDLPRMTPGTGMR